VPFDEDMIQPSSIDLKLGNEFRIFNHSRHPVIDVKKPFGEYTNLIRINDNEAFIVHPGEFVLGTTKERIYIPTDMVGRMEGKSSLGRLGIIIHATAGYFDPGFEGHGTLEINNLGKIPIALYPGMKICQMSFARMTSEAEHPYGTRDNKYLGQIGPTESRIQYDFFKVQKE
jgi:dCTP deaminase